MPKRPTPRQRARRERDARARASAAQNDRPQQDRVRAIELMIVFVIVLVAMLLPCLAVCGLVLCVGPGPGKSTHAGVTFWMIAFAPVVLVAPGLVAICATWSHSDADLRMKVGAWAYLSWVVALLSGAAIAGSRPGSRPFGAVVGGWLDLAVSQTRYIIVATSVGLVGTLVVGIGLAVQLAWRRRWAPQGAWAWALAVATLAVVIVLAVGMGWGERALSQEAGGGTAACGGEPGRCPFGGRLIAGGWSAAPLCAQVASSDRAAGWNRTGL